MSAGTRLHSAKWPNFKVLGIGVTALLVVLAGVGITTFAADELRQSNARSREQRLHQSAQQTTTLVTSVAETIQTVLTTGAAVAEATNGDEAAFRRSVRRPLADTAAGAKRTVSYALTPH